MPAGFKSGDLCKIRSSRIWLGELIEDEIFGLVLKQCPVPSKYWLPDDYYMVLANGKTTVVPSSNLVKIQ